MSDSRSKAEKLADGKKKLKKFQSKQKKPKTEDIEGCIEQAPASENGSEDRASLPEVAAVAVEEFVVEKAVETIPLPPLARPEQRKTPPHRESLKDELFSLLDGEKVRIMQLEGIVREQMIVIESMKKELQDLRASSGPSVEELTQLRDQLHSHMQALNLLVSEKADLVSSLTTYQNLVRERDQEIEELQAKLSASRHQVQDFKVESSHLREALARFEHSQQNLCSENETAREKMQHLAEKCDDLAEEASQAAQKLNLKTREYADLVEMLKVRDSELALAQLRVEQLSAGDTGAADAKIDGMAKQRMMLEQQVGELLTQVEKISTDRDQAATQYQNYVTQLNRESAKLVQKLQETSQERDQLSRREAELVKHVGELERQLQAQIAQPQAHNTAQEIAQGAESEKKLRQLEEDLQRIQQEGEHLKVVLESAEEGKAKAEAALKAKLTTISELEMKVERLEVSFVDPSTLSATLESEKVAAARAVSQNMELKSQLEEMQTAYVQMTHDKASLMDQLQSEQHLGREMRSKLDGWEEEVGGLREKLHFKDEEMMRLSHENSELEKKTLLQNQELDRLRHCEMGQQTSNVLQIEVQRQREKISHLEATVRQLKEERSPEEPVEREEVDAVVEKVVEPLENGVVEVVDVLPTEEAMHRLEERFRRTMNDIADLTEEKQRLEHLVTQLQGETETIGEYVTLYQTQRQLLKQREIEKDVQVQRIAADREEMKQKLMELNGLVELLLRQKNIDIPAEVKGALNGDSLATDEEEREKSSDDGQEVPKVPQITSEAESGETAERILSLLSEIKTNNLNTSNLVVPPGVVHHCSCCSGKLITV
ncbi:golgin subfamily A member 2 [Phlebotomus argentipes]|uniref:golgin subfamily A member 2 n=1 Tax=Phlebotomus argentipes TaxID=94469 RepID=UPI00289331ED|nr:golgin subfamily A member 2 [Phlebotomus argentipes]